VHFFSVFLFLQPFPVFADSSLKEDNALWVYPVVNAALAQQAISRNGLSAIFKMWLHRWHDGTPVTVFILKDENPLHEKFCKQILNVFPHQMRRAWNKAVFSGS